MKEIIITSSALILCVMLVRHFFKGKISGRLQYGLWLLVAVRLLVPVSAQIYLSLGAIDEFRVLNLAERLEERIGDFTGRLEQPVGFAIDMDSFIGRRVAEYILAEEMPDMDTADGATSVFFAGRIGVTWLDVFRGIWHGGMGIVALWMAAVNLRFRHKLHKERREFTVPEEVEAGLHAKLSGVFFKNGTEAGDRHEGLSGGLPSLRHGRAGRKVFSNRVKVYTVEHLASPCLYGLPGCESIYLPENITENENRLRHVLTHEICHKRHGDGFWSVIRSILLVFYWFHPLVWAAAVLSRRDCELACDESALLLLGEQERIDYGKTLLSIITGKGRLSDFACTATTMTGTGKSMKERICYIAEKPKVLGAAVVAVLFFVTAASLLVFTKSPQFSGGRWESGALYVMTGDKRIMLPDTIAGISGYAHVEGNDEDLIVYQVASDKEVGRFCTVTFEEAAGLVDADREVVPLGNYGQNISLKEYMGIADIMDTDVPEKDVTVHHYGMPDPDGENIVTDDFLPDEAEAYSSEANRSKKEPFAFDGKSEWVDDSSNQSTKKPFLFDGQSEWGIEAEPEEVTENAENGVPGTDSNTDSTTYVTEDETAGAERVAKEESADYLPDEIVEEPSAHNPNADGSTVYLPEEQITQVQIPYGPYTENCYIYLTADYSKVSDKYLEEMEYLNHELKMAAGQVIVTGINREITEETFETLAEYKTRYLGDNSKVRALVNALPVPEGVSYQNIELTTETADKSLQVNSCLFAEYSEGFDHDVLFLDAVMLFAVIENLDECIFAIEDEKGLPVEEVAYRRTELTERMQVESLWRDLEGEELQSWLKELHHRVVMALFESQKNG